MCAVLWTRTLQGAEEGPRRAGKDVYPSLTVSGPDALVRSAGDDVGPAVAVYIAHPNRFPERAGAVRVLEGQKQRFRLARTGGKQQRYGDYNQ